MLRKKNLSIKIFLGKGDFKMNNNTHDEEKKTTRENDKTRSKQILILIALCCIPLFIITGCGIGKCIQCSNCGDDNTRFLVYASGTEKGVEYTSCVGPAGILGCGCDSKCWPTECVSIKGSSDGIQVSGCVTYYNGCGCIGNTKTKSVARYSESATCLGIQCTGTEHVETVAETTKATESMSCLGVSCGAKESVKPWNINDKIPRAFPNGCWVGDD